LQAFPQQNNVVRVSPLQQAVAAAKSASPDVGGTVDPTSASGRGGVAAVDDSKAPPQVQALAPAARAGDKNALSMLDALGWGIGATGVLVAGGALAYRTIKPKINSTSATKTNSPTTMDAPDGLGDHGFGPLARNKSPTVIKGKPAQIGTSFDPSGIYRGEAPSNAGLLSSPQEQITDGRSTRFNQPASTTPLSLPDYNAHARSMLEQAYSAGGIDLQKKNEIEAAYAQKAAQDGVAAAQAELEKSLGQASGMRLKAARIIAKTIPRIP
jgi:hypothetical protein